MEGMATYSSILAWRVPMDSGAWWVTVYGVAKTLTRLSTAHVDNLTSRKFYSLISAPGLPASVPVSLTSTLNLDFWLGPTLRVGVNPVKAGSTQGEKLNGAVRGVYHKKCRLER